MTVGGKQQPIRIAWRTRMVLSCMCRCSIRLIRCDSGSPAEIRRLAVDHRLRLGWALPQVAGGGMELHTRRTVDNRTVPRVFLRRKASAPLASAAWR